jgi:hypothetical protein
MSRYVWFRHVGRQGNDILFFVDRVHCAWYILDDQLFPDDPAASAASSWGLGVLGMAASQGLVQKVELLQKRGSQIPLKVALFGALFTVPVSCVLV